MASPSRPGRQAAEGPLSFECQWLLGRSVVTGQRTRLDVGTARVQAKESQRYYSSSPRLLLVYIRQRMAQGVGPEVADRTGPDCPNLSRIVYPMPIVAIEITTDSGC